jgi:hypothetical protein
VLLSSVRSRYQPLQLLLLSEPEEEEAHNPLPEAPYQLEPPIHRLNRAEVKQVVSILNPNNSSGYDLITGRILKELPVIGIKRLT